MNGIIEGELTQLANVAMHLANLAGACAQLGLHELARQLETGSVRVRDGASTLRLEIEKLEGRQIDLQPASPVRLYEVRRLGVSQAWWVVTAQPVPKRLADAADWVFVKGWTIHSRCPDQQVYPDFNLAADHEGRAEKRLRMVLNGDIYDGPTILPVGHRSKT